jgi:multiple sugar transport system substrate-binding protein
MNNSSLRHLLVRPLIFITIVALSACSVLSPATPTTPTPSELIPLHIYTYRQPPVSQVLDIVTKAFQAQHPEVKITIDAITDDPAKQLASMASGTGMPDVIWSIDSLTPSLVDAGLLLDMREIANVDPSFKLDGIDSRALAMGSVANHPGLYMVPVVMDNVEMFYNKDLFKDSGAPLPGADWTWDDLIAACKQIQDAHSNVTCIDYSYFGQLNAGWWGYLLPWMRGYGGDALSADGKQSTFSSPESLRGIQAYVDLWTQHHIAAYQGGRTDCFVTAKCAVTFGISGGLDFLQERIDKMFEWDVQRMPSHPQGRYTGSLTYGYAISKNTQHRDLAWEFIKMMLNPEVQRTIALNHAGLPVLKSLATDASLTGKNAPANMQVFYQGGDSVIFPPAYPPACGNFYTGLVQSTLDSAVRQVITGSNVIDTFKQVDTTIQECLDSGTQ